MRNRKRKIALKSKLFTRDSNFETRVKSICAILDSVLKLGPEVIDEHKKAIVNLCLWRLTTAEAEKEKKYRIRYASADALPWIDVPKSKRKIAIRHDHVFCRAAMCDAVLSKPTGAMSLVKAAVGCVVTKDEHDKLTGISFVDGWDRYREAKIVVIDRETGEEISWKALKLKHRVDYL